MTKDARRCWLMKSEPEVYSIEDLARDKVTGWEGVRNYQARNFLRDDMKVGDWVLFYHSNAEPSGLAGLATIDGPAEPDPTQFDAKSEYHDEKSQRDHPTWLMVKVRHVETFEKLLPLGNLKDDPSLKGMLLLQKGQRLSVQPVAPEHFQHVLKLARAKTNIR